MPLCIEAASWQAVHHLVGSLAKLLQNSHLKQATSGVLLRLLHLLQCRHAAVCRSAAWQSHSQQAVPTSNQACMYGRKDRMEQPALSSQQNNQLWLDHCGDAGFYAQCAVSGLLTSAGASSVAGWKGNTAEK